MLRLPFRSIQELETKNINGVELIVDGDMVINHQERTGKPFESESLAYWVDHCKPGKTALDIGAYTGLYSIIAAKQGCKVSAFEPNTAVFKRLMENCSLNGSDVDLFSCAVGAEKSSVDMRKNAAVELTSGGKIYGRGDIPLITIDSMHLDDVCAVKIDVEGYEAEVLKGMVKTLELCRPVIITEALDTNAVKHQLDILEPLGYWPEPVDERNFAWLPYAPY